MTHGFYAQMGGFVLDTTGACPGVLPPDRSVLTFGSFCRIINASKQAHRASTSSLDSNIVASPSIAFSGNRPNSGNAGGPPLNNARESISVSDNLANSNNSHNTQDQHLSSNSEGELCDSIVRSMMKISKQDIEDKSKADGLAKTLVCVQALWFCVQCVSRIAQKLPITLLELNTFAHSLCALSVYILWWHKPLATERATSLHISNPKWIQNWASLRYNNSVPPDWLPLRRKNGDQALPHNLELDDNVAVDSMRPCDRVGLPR